MAHPKENTNMGAGVLFPTGGGKYLLQENEAEPGMPDDVVGTLRPAGGGKSKRDNDLHETIVRELGEEFGLKPDFIEPRLKLLGYIKDGDYKDCAMFELKDHGLKAKRYSASNSKYETVKLVEGSLSDKKYVGKKPSELREAKKGEYGYQDGIDKSAVIKKEDGKYKLYTKDGKRVLGTHDTRQEAIAQEYAIEQSLKKKASSGKLYSMLRDVGFSAMVHRMRRMGNNAGILNQINRRKDPSEYGRFIKSLEDELFNKGYSRSSKDFAVDVNTGYPVHASNLRQEAARASAPLPKKDTGPQQLDLW